MARNKTRFWIPILASLIFFLIGVFTIKDYGVNWDETIHFRRGQAYLHLFLDGKTDYSDIPKVNLQGTNGDPSKVSPVRRSMYQNDIQNGSYFLEKDVGHPPFNDIVAALFNRIFYQKLGILPDIFSYNLFIVVISSVLVFVVSSFVMETFGLFAAIIATLSLTTYPLFFAESHFNIKDPVVTAFFTVAIWTFYKSLNKWRAKWLFVAILFTAFAFGTKFNVVFLPFILFPYLFIRFFKTKNVLTYLKKIPKKYLILLILSPIIILGFLYLIWPFLQTNPINNFQKIVEYYKGIGSGQNYQPESYYLLGFNLYPIIWFILTTPLITLFFLICGLYYGISWRKKYFGISVLCLLWFFVPFFRVVWPGSSIYGGIRQIMEFLPAMAILSGIGALGSANFFSRKFNKKFIYAAIIILFAFPVTQLIKLHPYENVYFNALAGGLSGAKDKNIPSWGNSFGSAYMAGIDWINKNTEDGASLALIQGTFSNVPYEFLRKDIHYLVNGNIDSMETHFSGIERKGEYLMELTFDDTGKDFYYAWEYTQKFLNPVYETKVVGVPILTIWKNDLDHTKRDYKLSALDYNGNVLTNTEDGSLIISLDSSYLLSELKINIDKSQSCNLAETYFVETSMNGESWIREKDQIPQYQIFRKLNIDNNQIDYYFAGKAAKYVKVTASNNDCILLSPKISIKILK